MLNVITWLWSQPQYRSQFAARHVNVLASMVARHYRRPHRVCCVTDQPAGLAREVTVIPAWNDYADVPSPNGAHQPSCYRRLRAFHPEIGRVFGDRFVMVDLDTVIVSDVAPLWDRPEDFVIWGETDPRSFYNGSMLLMTAGARPHVWAQFDPARSPAEAKAAGRFGSDQGWISHVLGPGEATWTTGDGVYSYRVHLRERPATLPRNARMVMFHGGTDPWSAYAWDHIPWIRKHWRDEKVSRAGAA